MTLDWSAGRYEETAAELEPAAEHLVSLAGLRSGERVLDVACGTGNAALIAAGLGADVTGLDSAPRLVEVARARAAAEGLDVAFVVGDAQDLPFPDAGFDAALSVFGVIFAEDAARALGELVRVLQPGGRAVVSAWLPEGPVSESIGIVSRAMAEATGRTRERFPWHDVDAVRAVAEPLGASVDAEDAAIAFNAASPEAYVTVGRANHPMYQSARPLLERAGIFEEVTGRVLDVLRAGNEDAGAFRVTSHYRVLRIERRPETSSSRND
jgi:SAM-dependent methyltransferase